jgi:hypothetical protein
MTSGDVRLYGSAGFFSPGLLFTGGAVGLRLSPKSSLSIGVSRAWRTADADTVALGDRDRNELSAGISYALRPLVAAYAMIGRTFATTDANGAGTSLSAGLSFFFLSRAGSK